ncbi:MAG TPA: hypothetical protein VFO07_09125 [Roseiflexaceae bacterium]|nr:hypothetical protein [Roseiflexaceae bacterium]
MVEPVNTLPFLLSTIRMLSDARLSVWVFGGWAEELWGISAPRHHRDIDLLYPAKDFTSLDDWLAKTDGIAEIVGKRFSHKRAIAYQQVMVEFLLLEREQEVHRSNFFSGLYTLDWPGDTLRYAITIEDRPLNVASVAALRHYRQHHLQVQQAYEMYARQHIG